MTGLPVNPQRTYALVVGIEKYEAGPEWDLNGPAHDAIRFANWLSKRGLPPESILLLLSPLDENKHLMTQSAGIVQIANRESVWKAITNVLSRKRGDLLFIFWGGHGIATVGGSRRLFYADATYQDMLNLDVNELLPLLRSDKLPGFSRQICIIDACANYVARSTVSLPHESFSIGQPRANCEQFALFATRLGELAKNRSATKRTGRFSEALLKELAEEPEKLCLPDMEALTMKLVERFTQLRKEGQVHQTPSYFWSRDWNDNERSFGHFEVHLLEDKEQRIVRGSRIPSYSFQEKCALRDAMLACEAFKDRESRLSALKELRFEIFNNIKDHPSSTFHVMNIINVCLHYQGGLAELVEIIRGFEGDSSPMIRLDAIMYRLTSDA